MTEPSAPTAARHQLEQVDRAAACVAAHGHWIATYMAVIGLGIGVETVILGMLQRPLLRMAVFSVTWVALVGAVVLWSRSRRATTVDAQRRMRPWWIGSFTLYAVACFGFAGAPHTAAFWLPAGAVVAVPLLVGAWRERGRVPR